MLIFDNLAPVFARHRDLVIIVVIRFSEFQTRAFDFAMEVKVLVNLEVPPTAESIASSNQTKDSKYLSAAVSKETKSNNLQKPKKKMASYLI